MAEGKAKLLLITHEISTIEEFTDPQENAAAVLRPHMLWSETGVVLRCAIMSLETGFDHRMIAKCVKNKHMLSLLIFFVKNRGRVRQGHSVPECHHAFAPAQRPAQVSLEKNEKSSDEDESEIDYVSSMNVYSK